MQDETPLGKLMFDLHCTDPNQMHYPALATKSRYFKEDQEGVRKMCKAMEEMRNEAAIEATQKNNIEKALRLIHLGKLSFEEIALVCDLSVTAVTELAAGA